MLHHVAMEVRPDQMVAEGEFWVAIGFSRVAAPEGLGTGFDWYERRGTQVHLMETSDPALPPARGHVAVVVPDFEEVLANLRDSGCAVVEARQLWGERRAKAVSPSGHTVELMVAPPKPTGVAS